MFENNKELERKNNELETENTKLFENNKELERKNNELEAEKKNLIANNSALRKKDYESVLKYKDSLLEFHNIQEQYENSSIKIKELSINNEKLKTNSDEYKKQIDNFKKDNLSLSKNNELLQKDLIRNNIQFNELDNKYKNNLKQLHLDQEDFEKYFVFANDANALIAEQNELLKIASKIIKRILPYLEKKNKFNLSVIIKKKFLNNKN